MVGNRAAWVETGDTPYALATYLVGGTEDVGYVVVAPHGSGPEEPVVPSLQGENVWTAPVEALNAAAPVSASAAANGSAGTNCPRTSVPWCSRSSHGTWGRLRVP